MKPSIEVPWGTTTLTVPLPATWKILGTLTPPAGPSLTSPAEELREKLRSPIGAKPLRERDLSNAKILIVVEDGSRPTPVHQFFGVIKEELLAAGARQENISILTALGVHRPMTVEEVEAKVGRENLHGLTWFNHDAKSPDALVSLGTTSRGTPVRFNRRLLEADLILLVGGIEPHTLLGFSGGVKMILPGCAALETIASNHLQGVSPQRFDLIGVDPDDSPMRLDMEEAARMLGKDLFIVNAVMDYQHRICAFFCGDPVRGQREGVALSKKLHGIPIPEPADVLLTASAPMDHDMRQSMKCIGNNLFCARPGGQIAGFLRCDQGVGDVDIPPKMMPHKVLRTILRILGPTRIMGFVDRVKKGAGVEEKFLAHFSLQVVRRNQLHIYSETLPEGIGKKVGLFLQYREAARMIEAVAQRAPRKATAWFVPYGGITYPVLPASACRP